jgi:formylglycine-generating enzyme required for sulfatase activity
MPQFLFICTRYLLIAIPTLTLIGCEPISHNDTKIIMVDIPGSNFKLSQTEITFSIYDKYTNSTHGYHPSDAGWGRKSRPVINISWEDTQEFISWLNSTERPNKPYRLPTESEWELAASGGTSTNYWWGKKVATNNANCNHSCKDKFSKTSPVSSFLPNQYRLFDTSGNVWEWTQTKGTLEKRGIKNSNKKRLLQQRYILKGGSWENDISKIKTASRILYNKNTRHFSFGFRLAQDK